MANAFDQFDQQPAGKVSTGQNPFEQFDTPAAPKPTALQVAASSAESMGHGIKDPITGGAQLLAHLLPDKAVQAVNEFNNVLAKYGLVSKIPGADGNGNPVKGAAALDEMVKRDEAELQRNRAAAGRTGADWWRLTGNVVSPANVALAAKIPGAATLAGKVGLGAAQGGVSGALAPVTDGDFASEKAKQIASGAATGGAVPVLSEAAARVIKPISSQAVKVLTDRGISLTPGQILGGWYQRAEDALTSVPIIGDSIKGAQRRGIVTFNRAAINDALKPIKDELPKGVEGQEAIAYARKALGDKYDELLPKLKGDLFNGPPPNALPQQSGQAAKLSFKDELENIRQMGQNLPPQQRKDLNRIIDKEVIDKFTKGGRAAGETLKQIQETLNKEARNFANGGPYERTLSGGIKEIESAMRRMIEDVNPGYSKELSAVNQGYAAFKRAQRAASSVGAQDGFFTPAQYHNAVKALDKTKDKRAFAEGTAIGQELSTAAKERLSSKLPDSGTATRGLVEAALFGGGAHMLGAPYAAGALAAPAAYSKLGTQMAQAALLSRPRFADPLAQLVKNNPQAITGAAVPLAELMMSTQRPAPQ
jgi:hypothetical protein